MAKPQYNHRHQAQRRAWDQHLTATGPTPCRRCGQPVHCDRNHHLNRDGMPFDLGHDIAHAEGGDGRNSRPEHARCNRAAGQRLGRARTTAPASREW